MKEDQEKMVIVVPWDFTHVSDFALAHAVKIAVMKKYEIILLNIVASKTPIEAIEDARTKINKICEETSKNYKIVCKPIVKEGSVYSAISEYATQADTKLVVMGTHGRSRSQKIFGSKALRVLVGSDAPFIIVKSKPLQSEKISNVVFPIDFRWENKEKLQWAIFIAEAFHSKIHLFKSPHNDSSLQKKVNVNLNFATRFLKQYEIEYEIHTAPKKAKFSKETVNFAKSIDADLIIVMTTKHITVLDMIFGASEQKIIDNDAQIPVMCINPRAGYANMGQFMYGSSTI